MECMERMERKESKELLRADIPQLSIVIEKCGLCLRWML